MASVSLSVSLLPSSSSSTTTVSCSRLRSISLPCFRVRQSGASRKSIVMHAVPSESATLEQCQAIIAEQLGIDADTVKPDAKFSDLGADSLDTVEIVMALEEKFKIQVEQEGAEKIVTVKDASDVIHKLVSQKHA